jgi:hypothetical protein
MRSYTIFIDRIIFPNFSVFVLKDYGKIALNSGVDSKDWRATIVHTRNHTHADRDCF